MTLATTRLGGSDREPISLEVATQLPSASGLLFHLERRLSGLKVISKKSWAMTDDFEAYFTYKGRLFVLNTPFVNIWVSLIGLPADEQIFGEVETAIRRYGWRETYLGLLGFLKYLFLPINPPEHIITDHENRNGFGQ